MKTKYQPDAVLGNILVEVKTGMRAIRNLRTGLMQLAYALNETRPRKRGLLVLVDPKITENRLESEWRYARETLQPGVMDRLSLVWYKNGHFRGFPRDPDPEIRSRLEQVVREESKREGVRLVRGEVYYELLKILIRQWLLNRGPMTAAGLGKLAGCSYPSVASAVRRLGNTITRHAYRQLALARFPKEEWSNLLAVSDRARSTMRYADRSGQPRSPDALLRRLRKMQRTDIGVGGVFGARHYYPDLDLVGNPQLDLTIHNVDGLLDLDFVERLDPGLQQVENSREPASLVVHFIRRHDALFDREADGINWADPVECLLDLHEARLEPQALEFLDTLIRRRTKAT